MRFLQHTQLLFLLVFLGIGCSSRTSSFGNLAPRPMAARHLSSTIGDEVALRAVTAIAIESVEILAAAEDCRELFSSNDTKSSLDRQILRQALANETTVRVVEKNEKPDAFLKLLLLECRERKGSRVGVTDTAKVSFTLSLNSKQAPGSQDLNTTEIWRAEYSRTDQALSDNLLNLPDTLAVGPGWLTLAELSNEGLRTALRDFESLRVSGLLKRRS